MIVQILDSFFFSQDDLDSAEKFKIQGPVFELITRLLQEGSMEFSYVLDKAGEMRFHKYRIEIAGNQSKVIQTVKVLKDLMVGADSEIFGFFYIEIIIKVLLKVYF